MEVKPGYKMTEVGVVPEDWEVVPLGKVVQFLDGQRRPVKDADRARMQGTIPYYGASGVIDYVNHFLFDEELVLLGEDGENILSRNSRLVFRISGKTWVNNHAHVLRPNKDIDICFLTEFLESLDYEQYNSGTAQPKLNKKTCAHIPVALPSTKAEQEAIASALSDVDALIESLEQLVVKKRNIKQGAMQELLTGKRRLPGFSGEWVVRKLGDIAPLQRGFDLPSSRLQSGRYPVVYSNGILNHHSKFMVKAPGVVTGRSGTLGRVQFLDTDFWPHNTSLWVCNFNSNYPLFIYYLFIFIGLDKFLSGSGVPTLNRNDVHAYSVLFPCEIKEQVAISCILKEMDTELKELDAKLIKYRHLKQSMMQELLTGRIRLV